GTLSRRRADAGDPRPSQRQPCGPAAADELGRTPEDEACNEWQTLQGGDGGAAPPPWHSASAGTGKFPGMVETVARASRQESTHGLARSAGRTDVGSFSGWNCAVHLWAVRQAAGGLNVLISR